MSAVDELVALGVGREIAARLIAEAEQRGRDEAMADFTAARVFEAERDTALASLAQTRAEVERLRAIELASADLHMKWGEGGCITEPPCGACVWCNFDRALHAHPTALASASGSSPAKEEP